MRVLITGGTTTLGLALAEALLAAPDVDLVLAIGREPVYPRATTSALQYRSVDLTRPRALHDIVWGEGRELGIDVVVHDMQHRGTHAGGRRVHAQNVDAARELVLACSSHPTIRRFVYRSFAEVYALRNTTSNVLDENEPLDFSTDAPQWLRDRVEADLTVCSHLGGSLQIAVLRCAEILAPGTGSQLWDYLQSRVCLRPLGFDPMINVLSVADAVTAFVCAVRSNATGIFNIPGRDTLPLSSAIEDSRRADIPVPGPMMTPLYGLRRRLAGYDFDYSMMLERFHFGGVLDGTRARDELGFEPRTTVSWPQAWWQQLFGRLGAERQHVQ